MMAGNRLKVEFISFDGTKKSRNFSLLGFTRAYYRASKECSIPSKHIVKRARIASRTTPKPVTGSSKPKLKGLGSGFLVSSKGEVLTNYHVVEGCRRVVIDKQLVSIAARDKSNDLALLKTPTKPAAIPKFRLGRGIRLGEDIVVAGFPYSLLLGADLSIERGTVSRLKGLGGNRRSITISAPIQPGSSGGPVLDTSGNIVGVVQSKLDAIKTAKLTGSFPQNINFAINAATARAFLDSENVAYKVAGSSKAKSTADIAAEARKYTVLVQCWE